ncbi:MAG: helix-turn-helix transcriptional regulator [Candidatus Marinimicrobia bacterium]|nr:helix-turn-helix transcriptional regulator [Candidatus Neomarinimicrobiota bacterium]
MTPVAERLREFRAAVGLTQREVASLCKLGKRTIIYWEMGEREIKCTKLIPLADEYDLDFNWLIRGIGNMFNAMPDTPMNDLEDQDEFMEDPAEKLADNVGPSWVEQSQPFKKEQEDVMPLIQRLRRK